MKNNSPKILEALKNLPSEPGVYEMKNSEDETLYVGKAKNLKNRVKSYFLDSAKHSARIQKLVETVDHIEWTQTSSEIEALILEANLIKEKYPKFNILLRDDKNFSYLKISLQEDFPRITLVRRVLKDGAKYFGPKTSTSSVRKTIDILQDIFHFRSTPLEITETMEGKVEVKAGNQKYPCLNYHLKKCDAPCIGNISKADYRKKIDEAIQFLKGNNSEIINQIKADMMDFAKEGKYELAAKQRDKMLAIESIMEKQIISAPDEFSADIIGMYNKFGHVFFHLFSLREGKIINSQTFPLRLPHGVEENETSVLSEALKSFLQSHPQRVAESPKVIICDEEFFPEEEQELWENFFQEKFGHATKISLPQKGKRKKLLELAHENAKAYAKRHVASFLKNNENHEKTLETLQSKLRMKTLPKRMECYDISHFNGQKTVASMVVMVDGICKNSDYRSFNISSLPEGKIDDFASLQEATERRLKRLPSQIPEDWKIESASPLEIKEDKKFFSEFFYTQEGKLQKKKEVKFWSMTKGKRQEKEALHSLAIEKNMLLKTANIYLDFLVESNEPTGSKSTDKIKKNVDPASCRFFSFEVFFEKILQKARCQEYIIYTSSYYQQEILESLGFQKISEQDGVSKFHGKYIDKSKDSFSKVPDLMVIDGGKGQLSSVWEVLRETDYKDKITLCSIAKREEEIFCVQEEEIILTSIKKNSDEGHMLQRLRDEAHRFAITKNRVGRGKESMKSVLDEIRGLGPKTKKILKEKFQGVIGIRQTSDEELLEYVSEKVLKQLREKL